MRLREIVLTILPPIIWVGLIYYASSQPYEQQDLRPVLGEIDLTLIEKWFSWVSFTYSNSVISIEARGVAGFVEFFIRKGTHVLVFFVLGFLFFRFLKIFNLRVWPKFIGALLFVFLFAAIDEFRHFHHPNRTGLVEDVILDTIGGFLGACCALLVQKQLSKKKEGPRV